MNEFTEISLIFLETNFKNQILLYIGNSNKGINVKMHIYHFPSFNKPHKFYIGNSFLYLNTSKETNFPEFGLPLILF